MGGGAFPAISTREPWDGKDGEVSRGRDGLCAQGSWWGLILLPFPIDPCASAPVSQILSVGPEPSPDSRGSTASGRPPQDRSPVLL